MEDDLPPLLAGLRAVIPDPGLHKGTRECEVTGCGKTTREGKPYCSKHIEHAPYIQEVQRRLDRRAGEESLLEDETGTKTIPCDGFFVNEAILLLRTRDFTIKSFSRRLDITHKAAERLIVHLVEWGHAKRKKTSRGGNTVVGVAPKDLVDGI
jgi:predicted HTH transcriptional regulator